MIGLTIAVIVGIVLIAGILFLNTSPQFGGKAGEDQQLLFAQTGNFEKGKFQNPIPTSMKMDFKTMRSVMIDQVRGTPGRNPELPLPSQIPAYMNGGLKNGSMHITWFGHSTFLIQMDGKNILLDPMLGDKPSPKPMPGPIRYKKQLDFSIEKLPKLDAVLISHDHYDHLDYETIQKINQKVIAYYMPLGVGAHLKEWGVEVEKIHELNWWDEIKIEHMTFACTPARHFSGRGLFDRFTTLWCSWVIQGANDKIFYSGDSGYGPHFKEIGDKYGSFDLALMECGQYDERWSNIHMMPEETAQATVDVKAKLMMPMHWASFSLALHSWTDPIERVLAASKELNLNVTTPQIGETFILNNSEKPVTKWWLN